MFDRDGCDLDGVGEYERDGCDLDGDRDTGLTWVADTETAGETLG